MNVVLANRNIEIERTKVHASTVHALFQFDSEYKSKIDFGKHTQAEMELLLMEVFLLDEVSMLDDPCFASICDVMSTIDDSRQPKNKGADCFGKTHLIMFGDFKQETYFCVVIISFYAIQMRYRHSHFLQLKILTRSGQKLSCRPVDVKKEQQVVWRRCLKQKRNPVTSSKRASTFRRPQALSQRL